MSSTVIAVHHQENHGIVAGVVLTFSLDERYVVWRVGPDLNVVFQEPYGYGPDAYRRYVEAVAQALFTHHNQPAPGLSFEAKNTA
jgi:hypothetical protein